MKRVLIIEVISAILLVLFLYAGLSKIASYDVFVFQVSESPFKPLSISAHWIAWLIPVTEIMVATMLPFTKTRLVGFYGASGLMFAFTVYIGAMLLSGLPLPCACGGIISALHWPGHLVFNIFFLGLSVTGIYIEKKNRVKVNNAYTQSYSMG